MPDTDSAKRPDVEVVAAAVVDGTVAVGDVADPPVLWWSFTKTVLAAAALVLVDAGRLTLDTPLAGQHYTLRQLLQHRAGVPNYGSLADYHDAVASGHSPWPASVDRPGVQARARGRARHELDVFECGLSVRPPTDRTCRRQGDR